MERIIEKKKGKKRYGDKGAEKKGEGKGEKRRKDEDGDYRTSKKREVVVNMRTGFEREIGEGVVIEVRGVGYLGRG